MSSFSSAAANLDYALNKFITAMRLFISTELRRKYGDTWERNYFEGLSEHQKKAWGSSLQEGANPTELIDFGNLRSFALNQKDFFAEFLGKDHHSLPTMFGQINDARNMKAHYNFYNKDTADIAYLQMLIIAKKLAMTELEDDLRKLKDGTLQPYGKVVNPRLYPEGTPKPGITKRHAINLVNNYLGRNKLSGLNTVFSNINKAHPVWWLNIPPEKFNHTLNIVLVSKEEVIWIEIPKGSCSPPELFFNTRYDNGKIDLRIDTDGPYYLRDILSENKFDFNKFVKKRIPIK